MVAGGALCRDRSSPLRHSVDCSSFGAGRYNSNLGGHCLVVALSSECPAASGRTHNQTLAIRQRSSVCNLFFFKPRYLPPFSNNGWSRENAPAPTVASAKQATASER